MMLEPAMAEMMRGYLKQLPEVGRMVEVGTGYGESTLFFAREKPEFILYTIDGFGIFGDGRIYPDFKPDNVLRAMKYYNASNNIIQIIGNSQTIPWELPVDAIYIDGDHRYEGCKKDFEIYSPHLKKGGVIFFDDYLQPDNPTNGVKKVVDEILLDGWELLFADITAVVKRKV